MPRLCVCCHHPERDAIDAALVSGETKKAVADRYGLTPSAVERHARNHLSPALAAMEAAKAQQDGAPLLERVEGLIDRAERILSAAETDGKVTSALAAIKELRGLLELYGKASGELNDRPQVTVNLLTMPEWLSVRGALLGALVPYPDARAAVAGRLLELEAGE